MSLKSKIIELGGPAGGFRLGRLLNARVPRILMYHRFSKEDKPGRISATIFEKQVSYLKDNFEILTMKELIESKNDNGCYPLNSVVITVDDGYRDFYEIAFPILRKYGVSATFFVTTRFVDGEIWLWFDLLRYILDNSEKLDLSGYDGGMKFVSVGLSNDERNYAWGVIATYLLSVSDDKKNRWLENFARKQGVTVPDRPVTEFSASSWDNIREMSESGIEIGAHTLTHPSLGRVDEDQLIEEVYNSVDEIDKQLNIRPTSFCYPNGQPSDYTENVKKSIKEAGCKSAVTAFYDKNLITDVYELRRFSVSENWQYFLRASNGIDAVAAKWLNVNNIMTACV